MSDFNEELSDFNEELFVDADGIEYPGHDVLDLFEETFDPDGYTEEDYRELMDRI